MGMMTKIILSIIAVITFDYILLMVTLNYIENKLNRMEHEINKLEDKINKLEDKIIN